MHVYANGRGLGRHTVWTEPVSSWASLLAKMYQDPKRWTLTFQMRVLADYLAFYARHRNTPDVVFVERSLVSSMVFVAAAVDAGHLDNDELAVYMRHHTAAAWEPDCIVYIDAPPSECYARMNSRGRSAEKNVSLSHITKLDMLYRQSPAMADIVIDPCDTPTMATRVLAALGLETPGIARRHSF